MAFILKVKGETGCVVDSVFCIECKHIHFNQLIQATNHISD